MRVLSQSEIDAILASLLADAGVLPDSEDDNGNKRPENESRNQNENTEK